MNTYSKTSTFGSADWLIGSVKKNPEGLLLLAAGCALLLRAGGSKTGDRSDRYQDYSAGQQTGWSGEQGMRMERQGQSQMSQGMARAADSAREAAGSAREYASNVGKTVSETTGRYASAAGEYADEARRTIVDQSQRMTQLTQNTVERVVREQPWAVAIAGLAAGAVVAAAFPATRMERETLGVAGKGLSEAANAAGARLSEAASAAGERLMDVAEEKGLNTQGLKDVARDVAGTFRKSFGGAQDESGNASKQNTALSGGAPGQSGGGATHAGTPGGSDRAVGSTYGSGPGFGPKNPSR